MPVAVRIPTGKEKKEYSLYVSGNVIYKHTEAELGTFLLVKGTAVAFYSASNSRRVVVFQELKENGFGIPLEKGNIPYVNQTVRIIYKGKARKIDLMKFLVHNLEKTYGVKPYSLGLPYWITLCSYVDSVRARGKGSGTRKIRLITDRYIKMKERLYENIQGHSERTQN